MGGEALFEIIILAVVAGVLILRLRSVLGKRHGHERPRYEDAESRYGGADKAETSSTDNVTPFPGGRAPIDAEPPPVRGPASKVAALDPDFDEDEFLGGAKEAFRMILAAYAGGDRDTLRMLASNEVYEALEDGIEGREERDETLDATLLGIQSARIEEVETDGSVARVTVRFSSEQTNVIRNSEGQPIDGAPGQVETIVDLWTFERDMTSDSPNWMLIETEPGE